MTEQHGAKIMISDEDYARLENAANRRQVSLDYLCENIVNNYLCRYLEETVEAMWLPPEEKKEMLDKHSIEIDAKIYEGELRRKRVENAATDGNVTRMGSVVETLEIGDMYPELGEK